MARIEGIGDKQAGLLTRFVFGKVRKRLGKVIAPIRIHAHHPKLFRANIFMEMAQEGAKELDSIIKNLVQIRVSTLVGCPF